MTTRRMNRYDCGDTVVRISDSKEYEITNIRLEKKDWIYCLKPGNDWVYQNGLVPPEEKSNYLDFRRNYRD